MRTMEINRSILNVTDSLEEYLTITKDTAGTDRDDWHGESYDDCARLCRNGDMSLVAKSDKIMSDAESLIGFARKSFVTVNDVVGSYPDIGAYLSGHPMAMRRRKRQDSQKSPLTILVDLTCSANCQKDQLITRGVVCLTLLRLLAANRPVRIYVGTNMGTRRAGVGHIGIMTPIDSAPLDLARAAHIMGSIAFNRRLAYDYIEKKFNGNGHWPFGGINQWRPQAAQIWGNVFSGDILYVPPLFGKDKIVDQPITWLKDMLAQYGEIPH